MSKRIPEKYSKIFKSLSQEQLIEIVNKKGNLAPAALLYYPWEFYPQDSGDDEVCNSFSVSDYDVLMKNLVINRQHLFECCAKKGLYDKVVTLLKEPKIYPPGSDNEAIIGASRYGHERIVKLLLEWRGPDGERANPSVRYGEAIIDASKNGYDKVVKILLNWRGTSFDKTHVAAYYAKINRAARNQAFIMASTNGHDKVVKLFLEWKGPKGERIDPSFQDNEAIINASTGGHTKIVQALLAWKGPAGKIVDPAGNNNNAVVGASEYGHNEIVKLLLAWHHPHRDRVDPSDNGNLSIKFASRNGHITTIKLLANSPDIQYQKESNVLDIVYNAYAK